MLSNSDIETPAEGLSVEKFDDYVLIRHGNNAAVSREALEEFWRQLAQICEDLDCQRILLEGPDPGTRPDTMAAFASGVEAARVIPGRSMAICWEGFVRDDQAEFFKTVASNRGVRMEFFSDREQALKWLFS